MKSIRHIFRDFVFLVIIFQLFVFRNDFGSRVCRRSCGGPLANLKMGGGSRGSGRKLKQAKPNRLDNISNRG